MARSDETTQPRRSDGTPQGWDRRYAAADRIHGTPVPNRFLVSEISGLAPARRSISRVGRDAMRCGWPSAAGT